MKLHVTTVWDKRDFHGETLTIEQLVEKLESIGEDDINVIEIWCGEDDS